MVMMTTDFASWVEASYKECFDLELTNICGHQEPAQAVVDCSPSRNKHTICLAAADDALGLQQSGARGLTMLHIWSQLAGNSWEVLTL